MKRAIEFQNDRINHIEARIYEFQNDRINHLEARIYELEAVTEIDKSDARQIKSPEQVPVPESMPTTIYSKNSSIKKG